MSTPIDTRCQPCNCGSGFTVCRREPFVCGNLFVENLNAQDVRPQEQADFDQARRLEDDDEAQPIFPEFQDWYQARYEAQRDEAIGIAVWEEPSGEDQARLYSQGCSC